MIVCHQDSLLLTELQVTLLQCGFVQCRFDYTRENKRKQLFAERRKLDYTWSAKRAVIAYKKYHYCLKR
jgi:hypothetical protein